MHLSGPLCKRSIFLIPWYFGTPPDFPIHGCGAALDWSLSTQHLSSQAASLSTLVPIAVRLRFSDHVLCCCHLYILQASLSPNSAHPPSLPRVRDWSTVVASCQLLCLAPSWPTFLAHSLTFLRVLSLWTSRLYPSRKSSSIVHLFTLVVVPGPAHAQPLWWSGFHALVVRNGSWRDFRRSGSPEEQTRFRVLRQRCHSAVPASKTHVWNEWLRSLTSVSRRAPELLVFFLSSTPSSPLLLLLTFATCKGASRSALPPEEARSQWRAHFSSTNSLFLKVLLLSISSFRVSTSSQESG